MNKLKSITENPETLTGLTAADNPSTPNILKILEPITLPIAKSFSPFRVATKEVTSSGRSKKVHGFGDLCRSFGAYAY